MIETLKAVTVTWAAFAVLAAAPLALAQTPPDYVLQGRIFDFPSSHPDFERDESGLVTGQVAPELGPDGRMVWSGQESPVFSTKANFDTWYRDLPDVNMSRPFDLALTFDPKYKPYVFTSHAFFPIDGELLGNEGDLYRDQYGTPHNFHFTTHLAGHFTFTNPDDYFTFMRDDDLWAFFDGKLAIDIGGTHSPLDRTVFGDELMALGLEPGVPYRMDVFHAERHTTGSTFRIDTNFQISSPPSRELPAAPRDVVDPEGNKVVSLDAGTAAGTSCSDAQAPAQLLIDYGTEAPFLAAYCLDRSEMPQITLGAGFTASEAQMAALTHCFEAEGDRGQRRPLGLRLSWPCRARGLGYA